MSSNFFGGFFQGITEGLAQFKFQEFQRKQKEKEQQLEAQHELFGSLMKDPRATDAAHDWAFKGLQALATGDTATAKQIFKTLGMLGPEAPISQEAPTGVLPQTQTDVKKPLKRGIPSIGQPPDRFRTPFGETDPEVFPSESVEAPPTGVARGGTPSTGLFLTREALLKEKREEALATRRGELELDLEYGIAEKRALIKLESEEDRRKMQEKLRALQARFSTPEGKEAVNRNPYAALVLETAILTGIDPEDLEKLSPEEERRLLGQVKETAQGKVADIILGMFSGVTSTETARAVRFDKAILPPELVKEAGGLEVVRGMFGSIQRKIIEGETNTYKAAMEAATEVARAKAIGEGKKLTPANAKTIYTEIVKAAVASMGAGDISFNTTIFYAKPHAEQHGILREIADGMGYDIDEIKRLMGLEGFTPLAPAHKPEEVAPPPPPPGYIIRR